MLELNSDSKNLIFAVIPFFLIIFLSVILQASVIAQRDKLQIWLTSLGPLFILIYIILQTITIVIAPIGGAFVWLPMMAIMGPAKGLILSWLVATPAYFINFFLAKKYGRGIVKNLVGEKALSKIDRFVEDMGGTTLFILKIFQGGYFDYISYAAGLTKISFKTFFLVNIFAGIPGILITYLIFAKLPSFVFSVIALYLMTAILIGIFFLISHWFKKR